MPESYDVVIVGGGPGGYVAAIRATQLGLSTAIVERDALGGICLNRGCIPSKAMLRGAEILDTCRQATRFGVTCAAVEVSYAGLVRQRDESVDQLRTGVGNLLRNVQVIKGDARLRDSATVEVTGSGETSALTFKNLIIASGSRPSTPAIPGIESPGVIDSDGALRLESCPRRAVVVGAGAVGVEWAEIWRALGAEVMVLEIQPRLLPTADPEISRELGRSWNRKGITYRVGARIQGISPDGGGLRTQVLVENHEESLASDIVLLAAGRRPNVEGLNLEAAGVEANPGGIPTDDRMRTNVPNIYAVGDVTGQYLLAHAASHQGIVAAETIGGSGEPFDDRAVPSVVFTDPEIASVGWGETQARDAGLEVSVGRFPFAASPRAVAADQAVGFVKIIARQDTQEILGVHIIGQRAGEIIAEATLAIRLRATLHDLAHTIHAHPTFSEALMEAAWAALGTPIHVPSRSSSRSSAPGRAP